MRPYPVIDPRATGENILRRRRELGYSVLDVQKYLNLACPQAVYHWQKGRALPSLDNFFALSLMLDTTVNELIAEHKEVMRNNYTVKAKNGSPILALSVFYEAVIVLAKDWNK